MLRVLASLRISQARQSFPALFCRTSDPSHGSTLTSGTDERPTIACSEPGDYPLFHVERLHGDGSLMRR
jgi:hypothetical protein